MNYQVIGDLNELKFFWKYGIPKLQPQEAIHLSVSYRNKELNEEERKYYGLGRSEMCDAEVVRHEKFEAVVQQLRRWEYPVEGAISNTGIPKPQKARRIYVSVNPVDMMKSSRDLINEIGKFHDGLLASSLKGSKDGVDANWYGLVKIMSSNRSIFARNEGTRHWIDIDADFECEYPDFNPISLIDAINDRLWTGTNRQQRSGQVMAVRTKGGIHFLLKKSWIRENPKIIADIIHKELERIPAVQKVNEVVVNNNNMIPCPGTFMGEEIVAKVLNKKDFESIEPFHPELDQQ